MILLYQFCFTVSARFRNAFCSSLWGFFLPLIMRVSHLFIKPVAEISTCFRRQLYFFSLSQWVSIAKNSYRTELFCCVGVFAHVVSLKTD